MQVSKFILIDDDPVSNMIAKLTLEKILGAKEVTIFTDATKGLTHIELEYGKNPSTATILLLDINMPIMTGWEFLDQFNMFNETIKSNVAIYILSSSLDARDKERALANKNVKAYFVKPLTANMIRELTEIKLV